MEEANLTHQPSNRTRIPGHDHLGSTLSFRRSSTLRGCTISRHTLNSTRDSPRICPMFARRDFLSSTAVDSGLRPKRAEFRRKIPIPFAGTAVGLCRASDPLLHRSTQRAPGWFKHYICYTKINVFIMKVCSFHSNLQTTFLLKNLCISG
jgi:hypothetical protein